MIGYCVGEDEMKGHPDGRDRLGSSYLIHIEDFVTTRHNNEATTNSESSTGWTDDCE